MEKNKSHVVMVRLEFTEKEWDKLRKIAKRKGETTKEFIRTEARVGVTNVFYASDDWP